MRIATANAFDAGIDNLQRRQRDLVDAQERLTSGKRVQRASDDPTAAARAERALASIARSEVHQRAMEASRNVMLLTDNALADATELVQQARELTIAAGNATYSDAERLSLSQNLAGIRAQLLSVANRGDGSGGYLFSGQGVSQPPFVDAPGGVRYLGTPGQLQAAGDEALPLSMDGQQPWLGARSGNGVFETRVVSSTGAWIDSGRVTDPSLLTDSTYRVQFSVSAGTTTYSVLKDGAATALAGVPYSAGKAIEIDGLALSVSGVPADGDAFEALPSSANLSVFDTLDRAIAELKTPMRSSAQITQGVQNALRDLDAGASSLQASRSQVGETLNRADMIAGRLATSKLQAQEERSNVEDLDMVQALSQFQNQQTGYDAALKTYSMVQRMSLFQYLSV